ncbi:hypothetical protein HMI54_003658 [Coelomomyces lativittatus]|nr:hypothetical protein HMI56_001336 [Coelomomyces lativittatus]KAJ1507972.1 hypothetical protein HMI54_003658 [Coelomomyces lativittatus]KAJ1513259.1 hypothetical protein HMI55_005760 [Coelomomyces lativittatus]
MDPNLDMEPDELIPKIQVDSYEDIEFIKKQLKEHAFTILHSSKDELIHQFHQAVSVNPSQNKKRGDDSAVAMEDPEILAMLQKNMNQFVDSMLDYACENIEVNGLPFEKNRSPEPDMEPIDRDLSMELDKTRQEYFQTAFSTFKKRNTYPQQLQKLVNNIIEKENKQYNL